MTGLLVVGAGGHGKVVADAAAGTGAWSRIAFLDDDHEAGTTVGSWEILGTMDDAGRFQENCGDLVVAIGAATTRLELLRRAASEGFTLPVVVHPSAAVSPLAELGRGTVVLAKAAVNPGATLAEGCIVNTGATVDHDCELGQGVHVAPGAHLAGSIRIGRCSWIGIGASVREGATIGAEVTVGAGASVVSDLPDGVTAMGVPARVRQD